MVEAQCRPRPAALGSNQKVRRVNHAAAHSREATKPETNVYKIDSQLIVCEKRAAYSQVDWNRSATGLSWGGQGTRCQVAKAGY
jgi:hypothetical protein